MNKKGISGVVSTILILFITVVIAGIIIIYMNNYLESQKNSSGKIINSKLSLSIEDITIKSTGILSSLLGESNTEEQILTIILERKDNEETIPKGIYFVFHSKDGSSYTYESNKPVIEPGIPKSYELSNIDLRINDFHNIEKISISFILDDSSRTDILDEKEINF